MRNFLTIALALLLTEAAYGAVPLSFTHHGVLKENGELVNGSHNISAAIYDGNKLIAEKSDTISVESGLYTITIPNIDPTSIHEAASLQLAITIDGEELEPYLPINSVPYAITAQTSHSASSVNCERCITPDHLNFNALQDSSLPTCAEGELLRANGSLWECAPQVKIMTGKIGFNDGTSFVASLFGYKESEIVVPTPTINACACDTDNGPECSSSFTSIEDQGPKCFDKDGAAYHIFSRVPYALPIPGAAVLDGGFLGLGTGKPETPLHIRSASGENSYEAIVADTVPEILLEDLDGDDYKIKVDAGKLKVLKVNGSQANEVLSLGSDGLSVSGKIGNASLANNSVNSANIINLSIEGEDINKNTISVDKVIWGQFLNKIYPVGSIYLSFNLSTADQVATALGGGKWVRLDDNNTFWTASSNGGKKISAGLPNITGTLTSADNVDHAFLADELASVTGAFSVTGAGTKYGMSESSSVKWGYSSLSFSAKSSNSIYGASSTVQPPAYRVYAFQRTE